LIILSDGENHNDSGADIASVASEEGIKIFTIGVGTEKGGPIPLKRNGIVLSYKKDQDNQTVITKLNKETLKTIANEGNGSFISGNITKEVVEQVSDILSQMDKKEFEAKEVAEYKDQFQWFLALGLLFLLLDLLFLERKTAWLKRLNLFNENL
jgi:Ca-activated chloride channel family protein